jgi:hypothetical protein
LAFCPPEVGRATSNLTGWLATCDAISALLFLAADIALPFLVSKLRCTAHAG